MSILVCSFVSNGCGYVGKSSEWDSPYGTGDIVICPKCMEDHAFQVTMENISRVTDESNYTVARSLLLVEEMNDILFKLQRNVFIRNGHDDEYIVVNVFRNPSGDTFEAILKNIVNIEEEPFPTQIKYMEPEGDFFSISPILGLDGMETSKRIFTKNENGILHVNYV